MSYIKRPSLAELYKKSAKKHGFSDGIIKLIFAEVRSKLDGIRNYPQAMNILKVQTRKHILVMKQTNINQKEFLLDVFERFGKNDAQAAIDFVRHNMAEFISNNDNKENETEKISTEPVAVDLGLPSGTLWCDRNVGAKSPEDYGAFFSWGNVEPHFPNKENMDWGDDDYAFDYKFNSENYKQTPGYKLEGDIDLEHDAARVNIGEPWQMPTSEQMQELFDNCTWTRKTVNGVNGYLVTSKINGNSIFFACSGYGYGTSWRNRGTYGYYWSGSLHSTTYGRNLSFYSGGVSPQNYNDRFYGFAVRPVQTSFNQTK